MEFSFITAEGEGEKKFRKKKEKGDETAAAFNFPSLRAREVVAVLRKSPIRSGETEKVVLSVIHHSLLPPPEARRSRP